jgi:hypothetical protein
MTISSSVVQIHNQKVHIREVKIDSVSTIIEIVESTIEWLPVPDAFGVYYPSFGPIPKGRRVSSVP